MNLMTTRCRSCAKQCTTSDSHLPAYRGGGDVVGDLTIAPVAGEFVSLTSLALDSQYKVRQ